MPEDLFLMMFGFGCVTDSRYWQGQGQNCFGIVGGVQCPKAP